MTNEKGKESHTSKMGNGWAISKMVNQMDKVFGQILIIIGCKEFGWMEYCNNENIFIYTINTYNI